MNSETVISSREASLPSWLPSPLLLIPIALFLGLFINNEWSDPDTYAFFNRACLGGADFNTPFLAKAIFSILPCDVNVWFFAQSLLWGLIIFSWIWSAKRFFKIDERWFYILAFSPFVIQAITAFEDDFLAFPILIPMLFFHIKHRSWFSFTSLMVSSFAAMSFWEGALIPAAVIGLAVMNVWVSVGAIILGVVVGYIPFFNQPEIANETIFANGFLQYGLLWLTVFVSKKFMQDEIKADWKTFSIFLPMLVLSILWPKFGFFSSLPLFLYAQNIMKDYEFKNKIIIAGFFAFTLFPAIFIWNSPPNHDHWRIIDKVVDMQENGLVVNNYWSVGDYLAFRGGHPTQRGGFHGYQDSNGAYWLGPESLECETIDQAGLLFLQRC